MEQVEKLKNSKFYPILFDFTEPWKVDILEFLNDSYTDGLSMQDMYVEVGFKNPSHFSTAFKKQYGTPPTEMYHLA